MLLRFFQRRLLFTSKSRPGLFTLLEIVPVVSLILVLAGVLYFVLDPLGNFQHARNARRTSDLAYIADALTTYLREEDWTFVQQIPLAPNSLEICADTQTRVCSGKLDLNPLVGTDLHTVPRDPSYEASGENDPSSRYFVQRIGELHLRFFAPDTEPSGAEEVEVQR